MKKKGKLLRSLAVRMEVRLQNVQNMVIFRKKK